MKKTILNLREVFAFLFICAFGHLYAVFSEGTERDMENLAVIVVFAVILFFAILISPIAITFSEERLKIQYFFGIVEEIKWTNIRKIKKIVLDKRPKHLHFWCYHIYLRKKQDKTVFFAVGEIPVNRKTKKLLHQYYKPDL